MYTSTLPSTSVLDGGGVFNATRRALHPPVNTRYPFYRSVSEPQGLSGTGAKILAPPPTGFDPRTTQLVAQSLSRTLCKYVLAVLRDQ